MSKVFLKISLYLTALFLPVFFLWAWKQHNHVYPANDNAFYMEISQEIYLNYKSYGLWPATQFAFTHKHWKPIFHPVIGAMRYPPSHQALQFSFFRYSYNYCFLIS